jgi:hypothetical protein
MNNIAKFFNSMIDLFSSGETYQNALAVGIILSIVFGFVYYVWAKGRIEHYFNKKISTYKLEIDKEIEVYKNELSKDLTNHKENITHNLDFLLSRKNKWHEKEVEVLAEIWQKLVEANKAMQFSTDFLFNNNCKDFSNLDNNELELYLDEIGISNFEKNVLIAIDKKEINEKIENKIQVIKLKDFADKYNLFLYYFSINKIFIRPNIKLKYKEIIGLMEDIFHQRRVQIENNERDRFMEFYKIIKELKIQIFDLTEELQLLIQDELFPESEKQKPQS